MLVTCGKRYFPELVIWLNIKKVIQEKIFGYACHLCEKVFSRIGDLVEHKERNTLKILLKYWFKYLFPQ